MGPDSRDWIACGVCEDSNVLAFGKSLNQMLYDSVDGLQLGSVVVTKVPDWNGEGEVVSSVSLM